MFARALLPLSLAALSILPLPASAVDKTACVTKDDATICGEGTNAISIFKDRISPSGRYAIGWRSTAGLPEPGSEPDGDVSNVLVRLADGKVMAELSSDEWRSGEMHANRKDLKAMWSKDGRWLVSIFDERWGTSAIDVVAFDEADNVIGSGEVRAPTFDAAKADAARRKARYKVAEDLQYFALSTETHVLSDKGGRLRFDASLWTPKEGPYFHYKVEMRFKVAHTSVLADRLSVRFSKFEPAEQP
jgi:hypothetical protein